MSPWERPAVTLEAQYPVVTTTTKLHHSLKLHLTQHHLDSLLLPTRN
jgi:hypothetical protein